MPEFISSFPTGFEEVVARHIPNIQVYNGLVRHRGDPNAPFFNNSWHVLRFFQGKNLSFPRMVKEVESCKLRYPVSTGAFRVRFSRGNQFAGVDRQLSLRAESAVIKSTRLTPDRLNPNTELWYVIRDEGFGFYGQLLRKRAATEKSLHPGELRPEFAYLMCLCGQPTGQSVVFDPFAGYGSIPAQLAKHFPFERLIANDIDPGKSQPMCEDALCLTSIADASVGLIITDPPWGYYEQIGDIALFYESMLREFGRILRPGGRAVILSARKEEFMRAVERTGAFAIGQTIHTLVNGKKAGVYVLARIEV